jgi:hypothetical protein
MHAAQKPDDNYIFWRMPMGSPLWHHPFGHRCRQGHDTGFLRAPCDSFVTLSANVHDKLHLELTAMK